MNRNIFRRNRAMGNRKIDAKEDRFISLFILQLLRRVDVESLIYQVQSELN